MMLPIRSKNLSERFPVATVLLIVANVMAFGLTVDTTLHVRTQFLSALALSWGHITLLDLLSHMFLHESALHILGNMWFLYLFGFAVEGRLKSTKFLLLYFAAGIAGGLCQMLFTRQSGTYMIGASGGVMGVLGAALYLFPHSQVEFTSGLGSLRKTTTWSMVWVAAYFLSMDLVFAFFAAGSGVAHMTHIVGAAIGFGFCALFRVSRDTRQASEAKAMFVDVKDLSLLSSLEYAAMSKHSPDNTELILLWMQRNIRDGQVRADCLSAFLRLLPKIVSQEPAPYVGDVLISLTTVGISFDNGILLKVARQMEHSDEPSLAMRLYNCVLRNPDSTVADLEAALFRSGLSCERLNNRREAVCVYNQFIERFPMSPMVDQARLRLSLLPAA